MDGVIGFRDTINDPKHSSTIAKMTLKVYVYGPRHPQQKGTLHEDLKTSVSKPGLK